MGTGKKPRISRCENLNFSLKFINKSHSLSAQKLLCELFTVAACGSVLESVAASELDAVPIHSLILYSHSRMFLAASLRIECHDRAWAYSSEMTGMNPNIVAKRNLTHPNAAKGSKCLCI